MSLKVEALINSYTDAYRAQLNRARRLSADGAASPEMRSDLDLLLNFGATENTNATQTRA